MISESDRILARTECLILWDRLAETGVGKGETIKALCQEGKLHKDTYRAQCPLCEISRHELKCNTCCWPGSKTFNGRCLYGDSPFQKWMDVDTKKLLKKYAREVFNLIWGVDP